MIKTKWSYYGLLTILLNCLIIYCIFSPIIHDPDNFFFAWGGDGIKNYFTPLFFTKYNHGTWFTGMNYPFGDNMIFSDNQPALSMTVRFLTHHGIHLQPHLVGIMNILMLASVVVTAYILFLILSFYRVKGFYAMLFATGIAILSPQVDRFSGHYGLSYSCYIPLVWYFMLRGYHSAKLFNKYFLFLAITGCLFLFLYVYYVPVFLFFVALFGIATLLLNRQRKTKHSLLLLAISCLPFITLEIYSFLTDPVTDRLKSPYGFTTYIASWKTVFLPLTNNFFNLDTSFDWFAYKWDFEGLSYIGLTGLLFTAIVILFSVTSLFRLRVKKIFVWHLPPTLAYALIASIPILLFSMCYPFEWNMMWLADKFSFIKQFRSLGRFAWVFYYTYSMSIAYICYLAIRKLRMSGFKFIASALTFVIFLGWALDGTAHLMHKRESIMTGSFAKTFTNPAHYNDLLTHSGKKATDYQAILALPFFHIGSEKFYILNNEWFYEPLRASYQLGLPLFDESMARTSVSKSSTVIQWIADSLIYKSVVDSLPSSKPILLFTSGYTFTDGEKYVISKGKLIARDKDMALYELNPSDFKHRLSNEAAQRGVTNDAFKYRKTDNVFSSDSGGITFSYPNISFGKPDTKWWKPTKDSSVIHLYTKNISATDTAKYIYSAWVYVDDVHCVLPAFRSTQYDDSNKVIWTCKTEPHILGNVCNGWAMGSETYYLKKECKRLEITCEGYYMNVSNFCNKKWITDFIVTDGGNVKLYNNYPVNGPVKFQ